MRLYSRSDLVLIAGLTAAGFVVFSRPLSRLIEAASSIERAWGLNLISGLIVLTVVLVLHAQSRRHELRAQTLAAAAVARQAQARAQELEQLVAFGASLARALDITAIHNEAQRYLPAMLGREDGWVVVRVGGHWEVLVGAIGEGKETIDAGREYLTDEFFKGGTDQIREGEWTTLTEGSCLPLVAAGEPMGLIGIPVDAARLTDSQKSVLAGAGSVLAIAIRNADLFREVRDNSLRDGLTGCFNRMHAIETLAAELRRSYRSSHPTSAIMFDLDHFKLVNDQYGHQAGDEVLAALGRRLREVLRSSDIKCRWGGEEFLLVLPETPIEGARKVSDTVCREIGALRIAWGTSTISITASIGVTTVAPRELDPASVIARADAALYRAKEDGRNCVREVLPRESPPTPSHRRVGD
jgi:diguanylate cyclase (GGDEF)-like protein